MDGWGAGRRSPARTTLAFHYFPYSIQPFQYHSLVQQHVRILIGGGVGVNGGITSFGEEILRAVSTVLNGIFTNLGD